MLEMLTTYFNGEKYAGLLLAAVAMGLLIVAAIMFRAGPAFRSFALTVAVLALAQIALGVGLYLRTGPQVDRLVEQLRADPAAFAAAETPRMARVQRNFVIIEYVELAIILVTAIAAIALRGRPDVTGVALGLLITASMLLAFDIFAERRGAEYETAIRDLQRSL